MTKDSLISEQSGPRRLRAWNPLDHLRLLWWLLFTPGRLAAYWATYGESAERDVGKWILSTFVWLPLLAVRSASHSYEGGNFPIWLGILIWFLFGLVGFWYKSVASIVVGSLISNLIIITGLIISNVSSKITISVIGVLILLAYVGVQFVIGNYLEEKIMANLNGGRLSYLTQGSFLLFGLLSCIYIASIVF